MRQMLEARLRRPHEQLERIMSAEEQVRRSRADTEREFKRCVVQLAALGDGLRDGATGPEEALGDAQTADEGPGSGPPYMRGS